ncbi:TPA: hypothetical protein ACNVDX_002693 [Citrobacter gillenii]
MAENLVFNFKNQISIHYRFKPAVRDCRHLLIVMSGFNIPDPTVYDFTMLDHCHSAILWIKDDFGGLPAYYLCNEMNFDIEQGISLLIQGVIDFVKPADTTILGASKGGSMSLYYGLKHNIQNIITAVPQFYIGSYVAEGYWASVGVKMMGGTSPEKITKLDNLLIDVINKDKHKNANIYLFTSPDDKQFSVEIEPNLALLHEYANFNLVETCSSYAKQHNQITRYNLNVILSIIYQLENNITPAYGQVRNGDGWLPVVSCSR